MSNYDRGDLVQPAKEVIDDGIDFWANDHPPDGTGKPLDGRVDKMDEIIRNRTKYKEGFKTDSNFADGITDIIKSRDLDAFAGAILYLAAAGYKDKGSNSELIGSRYNQKSEEAAKFVIKLNKYSILDGYSINQISTKIINENDELYDLLSQEVTETRENIQDLNVPDSVLENNNEKSFLHDILEERQEKMKKAVKEYVDDKDLYQILENIEDAILETGESAKMREEITETIETEIADLENQLQWALKNNRQLIVNEIEDMAIELEQELLSADELKTELGSLEGELQWAFREHREFLLQELEERYPDQEDHLTPDEAVALFSEQRDDIVESLEESLLESQQQIDEQLEQLREKQRQLGDTVENIKNSQQNVPQKELQTVIKGELKQLTDQQNKLDVLINRFERERERLGAEVEELQETPKPPEPIAAGSEDVEGTEVIPASVARLYEQDFIARIERSVRNINDLYLPDDNTFSPESGYWNNSTRHEQGSFQGNIMSELPDDAEYHRYPERPWVRFAAVESTGFLGRSKETKLVIEGVTLTRLSTYAEHGSDWAPATLSELHGIVGEALDRGIVREQEDAHHLLVVGSPTGWKDNVKEEVESGSLIDSDVSVCLVDLRTDGRSYYRRDDILRNNGEVFSHELQNEEVHSAAIDIKKKYAEDPSCQRVLLEQVVEELDYPPHIVKRAFTALEERGVGKQIDTNRGLLLSFEIN